MRHSTSLASSAVAYSSSACGPLAAAEFAAATTSRVPAVSSPAPPPSPPLPQLQPHPPPNPTTFARAGCRPAAHAALVRRSAQGRDGRGWAAVVAAWTARSPMHPHEVAWTITEPWAPTRSNCDHFNQQEWQQPATWTSRAVCLPSPLKLLSKAPGRSTAIESPSSCGAGSST